MESTAAVYVKEMKAILLSLEVVQCYEILIRENYFK